MQIRVLGNWFPILRQGLEFAKRQVLPIARMQDYRYYARAPTTVQFECSGRFGIITIVRRYEIGANQKKDDLRAFKVLTYFRAELFACTEGRYNERVVRENSNRYFLMDRNLTYLGGAMEFCDIFSRDKELIHIKRYGGSATLSHLFYQGVNSAELFQMEDKYRNLIRDKLSRSFRVFDPSKRPGFEEYHVVFGIISRSDKPLTMPFFSRVGLRHAMRRLQGLGYKFSLAKIGVVEARSKLQKVRPKPIRQK